MVKTYDCTDGGAQWCQGCYTMTEDKDGDGDWVRKEDYDALAAELVDWRRMRNEAMALAMSNRERIRELEAQLSESEQHRTKNRETAVALQDEVTDLRMKLGFRDAHIESLQNKWASRPLSSEDEGRYIEKLEAAARAVVQASFDTHDHTQWFEPLVKLAEALDMTPSETPEAMHARIVTETADAIASQMETKGEHGG